MDLNSNDPTAFAEPILILIEGQTYASPEKAAEAYQGVITRLMTELPDRFRTRANTQHAVYKQIEIENVHEGGMDPDEFALFWSHVLTFYSKIH